MLCFVITIACCKLVFSLIPYCRLLLGPATPAFICFRWLFMSSFLDAVSMRSSFRTRSTSFHSSSLSFVWPSMSRCTSPTWSGVQTNFPAHKYMTRIQQGNDEVYLGEMSWQTKWTNIFCVCVTLCVCVCVTNAISRYQWPRNRRNFYSSREIVLFRVGLRVSGKKTNLKQEKLLQTNPPAGKLLQQDPPGFIFLFTFLAQVNAVHWLKKLYMVLATTIFFEQNKYISVRKITEATLLWIFRLTWTTPAAANKCSNS